MANLNDLLQKYVNHSYDELLSIARTTFVDLRDDLIQFLDNSDQAATACLLIIASCVSADGTISRLEHQFLNDLLGSNRSYETTVSIVNTLGDEKGRALANSIADSLSPDKKANLLIFCLCFLAVDETITRDEVAYLNLLIQ